MKKLFHTAKDYQALAQKLAASEAELKRTKAALAEFEGEETEEEEEEDPEADPEEEEEEDPEGETDPKPEPASSKKKGFVKVSQELAASQAEVKKLQQKLANIKAQAPNPTKVKGKKITTKTSDDDFDKEMENYAQSKALFDLVNK